MMNKSKGDAERRCLTTHVDRRKNVVKLIKMRARKLTFLLTPTVYGRIFWKILCKEPIA